MVLHVLLFISYHKRYLLYPPFISKQQWLLQSYPCLFWENGYTQCPCWRNIWDLIISRVPDLRLAIVNKISWVNNAFNRSFNTREGWGTHCSPNCENQIIIVIAKPFPSFRGTVGVSFFLRMKSLKTFMGMRRVVLYIMAIKFLTTTTPTHKTESIFLNTC